MRKMKISLILLVLVVTPFLTSCERRPLEDDYGISALIPVKIDWTKSNIPVTEADGSGHVHRVSIRFFPKDGSAAFDRYLEGNVIEGEIEVPIGDYAVVVFNESIHDLYWEERIYFTDVNKYSKFAAHKLEDNVVNYPFYQSLTAERLIFEPFRMASWSLASFSVTREMVENTRSGTRGSTRVGDEEALLDVVMYPLTYNVNITVQVDNLASAQLIQGAMRGFSSKVYMASREAIYSPATYVHKLNSRVWNTGSKVDGTVSKKFLSFGRHLHPEEYWLNMDVVFIDGTVFEQPLLYNVTDQVVAEERNNTDINIRLSLLLPLVTDGIYVGDWDDEVIKIP